MRIVTIFPRRPDRAEGAPDLIATIPEPVATLAAEFFRIRLMCLVHALGYGLSCDPESGEDRLQPDLDHKAPARAFWDIDRAPDREGMLAAFMGAVLELTGAGADEITRAAYAAGPGESRQ